MKFVIRHITLFQNQFSKKKTKTKKNVDIKFSAMSKIERLERLESQIVQSFGSNKTTEPKQDS